METKEFQELVLQHLGKLAQGQAEMQKRLSSVESKLDLVYNHVAKITEDQTANEKRTTKIEKDTASLAELYGKHEVEIRSIKSAIL